MPFPDIDPVLIHIGPFAIRWYALGYVAGILIGWRYITSMARNQALWPLRGPPASPAQIDDLILWITLGIIVGGRLGHVFFYTPALIVTDPLEVFKTWKGGMSFHGGVLGVLIATLLFARVNKVDVFRLGDVITAAAPIGIFFVRIANFINGELWGRPTSLPWGVVFPDAGIMPRHPSQIYEALLEGLLLFIILRIATHHAKLLNRRGVVAGMFFLGYGIARTLIENVREPDAYLPAFPLGLTMGMMLSIPMALGGAWLIWRGMREPLPQPEVGLEAQVEEVVEGEPPARDPFKIETDGPA
ncbi:MAG: prolipoprotein diacylglyceryl transferase [Phenylobacterium sp.]|uniref:Phosphatidylglycerol--prolipoprotein diacylglyceryl transferase n=1 Tax=Phenylobacterium ferrooxidans TaxID=2982689 RepID=A0ABW6CSG2_9CAUL|nr:prolipoprotein diacylglyceryl transferase [Phenylobacterium sp.]MDO8323658.1 prolipoprotein diacylglyceryl transferase [Phenylobacterium sp.]MDO8911971.1 prolipoprotein diacylglyceryl transferase [Phenylobacterium sp.]MDP3100693.1 prolipoprotein diacylglyceryl transferase [Phenylobacterium sp.]MDP3634098.1 prolipoprotein diacylglyceryl transferase [Phenylobacterium sp.]MDP3868149.1 prolipoprotein diacylglyceryl transferase [Phenylobacterium sp.]